MRDKQHRELSGFSVSVYVLHTSICVFLYKHVNECVHKHANCTESCEKQMLRLTSFHFSYHCTFVCQGRPLNSYIWLVWLVIKPRGSVCPCTPSPHIPKFIDSLVVRKTCVLSLSSPSELNAIFYNGKWKWECYWLSSNDLSFWDIFHFPDSIKLCLRRKKIPRDHNSRDPPPKILIDYLVNIPYFKCLEFWIGKIWALKNYL